MNSQLHDGPGPADRSAQRIVDQLARVAMNVSLYGLSHRITREHADDVYLALTNYLHGHSQIELGVHEDIVLIDAQPVLRPTPVLRNFASRLSSLGVSTFTITRDLDLHEFQQFFALIAELAAQQDDQVRDFAAHVESAGLKHIQSDRAVYRRVASDQKVVDADEGQGEGDEPDAGPPTVEDMSAFVDGDSPASIDQLMRRVREGDAEEAQHIADLIVDTIAMRHDAGDADNPEHLRELASDCLRKVYESIIDDSALKTRKGRRHLRRVMSVMEKHIVVRLKTLTGADPAAAMREVKSLTHGLREAIKVDDLVDQYVKRRRATQAAEADLERLIRLRGSDVLKKAGFNAQMNDAGVPLDSWYVQNMVPARPDDSDTAPHHGTILGVMLEDLSETARLTNTADISANVLLQAKLSEVETEVAVLLRDTADKIDQMTQVANDDSDAPPEQERRKRRTLMTLLAEVVQELCQPLSVITCSIDILKSAMGQSMKAEHRQATLELAYESAERLQILISRLGDAAGVPDELSPDTEGTHADLIRRKKSH